MSFRGKIWVAGGVLLAMFWGAAIMAARTALSQEAGPPAVQALYARYAKEVNSGIACETEVIALRARVAELEKQAAESAKPKDDTAPK